MLPTSQTEAPGRTSTVPRERERERTGSSALEPHQVVLHNDDHNSMDHVVRSLVRSVPNMDAQRAVQVMLEAHNKGRVAVWIGALEVAELKADQIRSFGADPFVKKGGHPLGVSVEPAA